MSFQFTSLHVGDQTYPILSNTLSFEAESTKKEDATKVGIGSGIGAVVGAIAGGGKGAAIGAAVGAGAGGATVAATRGKELKYEAEHPFEFTLEEDVKIALN
jgi:outer membrane lipoprotein SlyB